MSPTTLPQLDAEVFLTDGGLETTLVFDDGIDLPDFAAFGLLDDDAGGQALVRYYDRYAEIAAAAPGRHRAGHAHLAGQHRLGRPPWAVDPDGPRSGSTDDAVALSMDGARRTRRRPRRSSSAACIGPRATATSPASSCSVERPAATTACRPGPSPRPASTMITAITMTHVGRGAAGRRGRRAVGLPVVISFTVETDGSLPSGEGLGEAIAAVDAATGAYAAYYMVNCAHPDHFAPALDPAQAWTDAHRWHPGQRLPDEPRGAGQRRGAGPGRPRRARAGSTGTLRAVHPHITVLGGCCGTDHTHVDGHQRRQRGGPGLSGIGGGSLS